ncbi:hypothetical protein WDU94_010089 [Cyamophila willieti]
MCYTWRSGHPSKYYLCATSLNLGDRTRTGNVLQTLAYSCCFLVLSVFYSFCRLLDSLAEEPPWAEGDVCLECGTRFGLTMRKHHCRHCGRLLCSKCSSQEVPILKFNLAKPVRVCEVCVNVISGIVR